MEGVSTETSNTAPSSQKPSPVTSSIQYDGVVAAQTPGQGGVQQLTDCEWMDLWHTTTATATRELLTLGYLGVDHLFLLEYQEQADGL